MNCDFNTDVQRDVTPVRIKTQEILQKGSF